MKVEPFYTGRVPSKAERRTYLRQRGWISVGGSWRRSGDSGFWTLAAAYRHQRGLDEAKP